ncbi:MAG: DUF1320 domain-containing protein [Candidatus Riflebacteria bacterium]|nr:DUF1320 domain-containing protein [Candidatus Riflebacteria bacterium]
MTYCTQDDIEKQIPEQTLVDLTDDDGVDAVDEDIVARAIADADEEIDSFVSVAYSLPLASTPGLVRRMSVDLAIGNLYAHRPHLEIPETLKDRIKATRQALDKLALGKIKLDVPDPASAVSAVDIDFNDRIFTRDKMDGF